MVSLVSTLEKIVEITFLITLLLFSNLTMSQNLKFEVEGNAKIRGHLDLGDEQDASCLTIGIDAGISQSYLFAQSNTFVGSYAGRVTDDGFNNSFFGAYSGRENINGHSNAFFGTRSGHQNTNGFFNSFFGPDSGAKNTTGSYNSYFGASSGMENINGHSNAFFGLDSGRKNIDGHSNAFFGARSGHQNTNGFFNSFFGPDSGANNTFGSSNSYFGHSAGASGYGHYNTFLGAEANTFSPGDTLERAIAIGYKSKVDCSNCAVIGGTGEDAVNVGIGTPSPQAKLHLGGGDSSQILLENGGDLMWKNSLGVIKPVLALHTDNNVYLDATTDASSTLIFRTNPSNAEQMVISSSGDVGIGTSTPGERLHVDGNVLADAYNMPSSQRWKTNIKILPDALDKVVKLRGVEYDWKDSGKHDIGLIAEEVGAIIPEVVAFEKNGIDARSVDYARLVPILIEAIKDLNLSNQALQDEVEQLKLAINNNSN
ncbi:MAG: tail fiber domain-containing protein [Saprospiraceae bacterium]|nr:tail fiber domain-containing protein [Saprospiraceae bacterium]